MKKEEQKKINNTCMEEYKKAMEELQEEDTNFYTIDRQLRSCNASVYTTANYYILKSYNTIVAVINRNTDTLYDVLRVVYGYTATSSQHISKFAHDYKSPADKWAVSHAMIAR